MRVREIIYLTRPIIDRFDELIPQLQSAVENDKKITYLETSESPVDMVVCPK